VKALLTIGEDAARIEQELKAHAPVEHATDMPDAVRRAAAIAQPGDTVLLAPACASFDMFDNFEHRGRVFKEAVKSFQQSAVSGQPKAAVMLTAES
jgi:UDP-N-acetylmuramoylalanine--D-glutamate ligase